MRTFDNCGREFFVESDGVLKQLSVVQPGVMFIHVDGVPVNSKDNRPSSVKVVGNTIEKVKEEMLKLGEKFNGAVSISIRLLDGRDTAREIAFLSLALIGDNWHQCERLYQFLDDPILKHHYHLNNC